MTEHTYKQFDTELKELKSLIYSMFKISRKNIKQSLKALINGDLQLAKKVIGQDEAVDAFEVQADEVARNIIVHQQPAGSDLRFVFAAIKIVTDLERLSDMAVSIARDVLTLQGIAPLNLASIPVMQEMILDQLKNVRHAYLDGDVTRAQSVIESHHLINVAFIDTQRIMLTYMAEDPAKITQCVLLNNIAKMLERMGDHATNIAEMVIYSSIGYEVRHIEAEEIKQLLASEEDD